MLKKKSNYWLVSLLLLLLVILFMWNEKLDVGHKINHEKISSFFVIISVVATTCSLILIYRQLLESKRQNDFAIEPALFVQNKSYVLKQEGPTDSLNFKSFMNVKVSDENNGRDKWGIIVTNVGKGTAIKIEIEWEYDLEAVKSVAEEHYWVTAVQIEEKFFKNYMKTDEELSIKLPFKYLNLFGRKLHPNHNTSKNINTDSLPELHINVRHMDIQHKAYEKKFVVKIDSNLIYLHFDFIEV